MPPAPSPLILAACSGGADSMALASALAFEAPRLGLRAGGITVDHGLQDGSAERAREVADRMTAMGLDPVGIAAVTVGRAGGPEAAARTARYAALDRAAERHGAVAVLLGHTRDDQAETVLLGLARGSGIRSLAGMPAVSASPAASAAPAVSAAPAGTAGPPAPAVPAPAPGAGPGAGPGLPPGAAARRYRRPFLRLDRRTTRTACAEQGLPVWDDPHNTDPAYARSRVRHEALPVLEKALGRGVVEALARTARLSRDDADALDAWAQRAQREVTRPDGTLDVAALRELPPAVRRRVLRSAAIAAGAPAGSLFARHIEETDRLITAWRGQRPLNLPGRVEARRQGGRLVLQQADG
ncbi:tRNA lysidine(34) synthetase TilS [Streptomyces sp. YIM 98790]|uniref:tRNA lysidine(34) synthetase TilS n=1 Tax=Streptomyces sp. YIM 98790 TaxID=2689077 RepID=UPI0037DDBB8E